MKDWNDRVLNKLDLGLCRSLKSIKQCIYFMYWVAGLDAEFQSYAEEGICVLREFSLLVCEVENHIVVMLGEV